LLGQLWGIRDRLESVIENIPAGLLIPPSAKIIMGKGQCESILGHQYIVCNCVEDYIGYRGFHPDGSRIQPHEWPMVRSVLKREVVTGEEIIYRRGDGRLCSLQINSAPIRDKRGGIVAAITTFQDITGRKRDEEELAEAKAQAEPYPDPMGHDINNMNMIAMGNIELAREIVEIDGQFEGENIFLLDQALEPVKNSSRLIDNIRKLQQGKKGSYKQEVYDLGNLLNEVSAQHKSTPDKYVKIISGTHNGVHVEANELLKDGFANLIGNAIKHSTGHTFINIRMVKEKKEGRPYCMVTIEDNGSGIPDAMKDRIFDRLHVGNTKAGGSGLGLYLVKSLVDSYGGRVWVEDRMPDDHTKGAKFMVMLPMLDN
jgi:signal transduction histidine kinase